MADVFAQRVDGTATHAIRSVYTETRPDTVHVPRRRRISTGGSRTRAGDVATYVAAAAVAARWRRSWSAAKLSTAPKSAPVGRTADDYGIRNARPRSRRHSTPHSADLADVDVVTAPARGVPGVLPSRLHSGTIASRSPGSLPPRRLTSSARFPTLPTRAVSTRTFRRRRVDAHAADLDVE